MKKSPGQNSHTKPQIFTDDLKKNWVELIREKDYKFSIKEINMQKKKKRKRSPTWWCRGEESTCQWRRHKSLGLIPGWGRSPGEGNSHPLQHSCLGNPMDRGAWRAAVHGVTRSQTRLSNLTQHTHSTPTWKKLNFFNDNSSPNQNLTQFWAKSQQEMLGESWLSFSTFHLKRIMFKNIFKMKMNKKEHEEGPRPSNSGNELHLQDKRQKNGTLVNKVVFHGVQVSYAKTTTNVHWHWTAMSVTVGGGWRQPG